jgi:peptidoglycan/LPS O-acetylase OafA/YrhL
LSGAAIACLFVSAYYCCFIAGIALAVVYSDRGKFSGLGSPGAATKWWVIALLVALVCLGYANPRGRAEGFYSFLDRFGPFVSGNPLQVITQSFGALLLLAATLFWAPLRSALSGRHARALGSFSFPIYLTHMPVMLSLTSLVYLTAFDVLHPFVLFGLLATVTIAGIFAASWPLAIFDRWWVGFLNRTVARFFAVRQTHTGST